MNNDICATCGGDGGYNMEDGWLPCYHCRESGLCKCEECHPKIYDFTAADLALADQVMAIRYPHTSGWAVYVSYPAYDNRDGLCGTHTTLAAVFTSEHSAYGWAMQLEQGPDGEPTDCHYKVMPCLFNLTTE